MSRLRFKKASCLFEARGVHNEGTKGCTLKRTTNLGLFLLKSVKSIKSDLEGLLSRFVGFSKGRANEPIAFVSFGRRKVKVPLAAPAGVISMFEFRSIFRCPDGNVKTATATHRLANL